MSLMDAMHFRHACKAFDPKRQISAEDQGAILEFGRLSPSSFGSEPWHFLLIRNDALRMALRPACWNQAQITDSSFIILYLSRLPRAFRRDSTFMRERLWRRSKEESRYQQAQARVIDYLAEQNTGEWAKRQTYLALANMMTGAASLGIDSCPIEGFYPEALKVILKDHVDWTMFDSVALCAFGYRALEQTRRFREPIEAISTCID